MLLGRFAFQACSFNHSDISPFRINSLRRSETVYRKTLLQIVLFRDAICIQRFADLSHPIFSGTVSDLRISFDHLRRSGARITSSTSPTTAVLVFMTVIMYSVERLQ